jgi:integrase
MTERKATLMIRYKTTEGWKRCPAVRGANGRIKPGFALIDGDPVKVDRYYYEVRYYENRQNQYENAGMNVSDAETLRRRIENQSTAKAVALSAGLKVEAQDTRKTLKGAAEEYIQDALDRHAAEAAAQARNVTAEFIKFIRKTYVDEVTRKDVLRFHEELRKRGCSDRTVANKNARLASWLRFAGIDKDLLPPKPKYELKLPTVYSPDQISSILGAADPYMRLVILLALKCGLRDQEIAHLEWSSVDLDKRVLRVRGNPEYGFRVKDSEQRELPIPADLLDALKVRRDAEPNTTLVVGTEGDKPNRKLLRSLKRLVTREHLGCGHCKGCKIARDSRQEWTGCREWTLHRFRRTYATRILQAGSDIKTVQALMGHADLASTMRYLRPAESDGLQDLINRVKW